MRHSKLAAVAIIAWATPSLAQDDPIVLPVATDSALPVYEETGFDWDGFYAGVYGTGTASAESDPQVGVGLNVGFNHAFDFVLVGGEVAFHPLGNDEMATAYLQAVGRGGVLVTDNLLLFGAAGLGTDVGADDSSQVLAGVGLEYGITDSLSLRGQFLHGFPVTSDDAIEQVTVGAEFHF